MADTMVISDLAESTPYLVGGIPVIAIETPVIFEDEGQEEMGDSAPHSTTIGILLYGINQSRGSRFKKSFTIRT